MKFSGLFTAFLCLNKIFGASSSASLSIEGRKSEKVEDKVASDQNDSDSESNITKSLSSIEIEKPEEKENKTTAPLAPLTSVIMWQCYKQKMLNYLEGKYWQVDSPDVLRVRRVLRAIYNAYNNDLNALSIFTGNAIFGTGGFLNMSAPSSQGPYRSRGILQINTQANYYALGPYFYLNPYKLAFLTRRAAVASINFWNNTVAYANFTQPGFVLDYDSAVSLLNPVTEFTTAGAASAANRRFTYEEVRDLIYACP